MQGKARVLQFRERIRPPRPPGLRLRLCLFSGGVLRGRCLRGRHLGGAPLPRGPGRHARGPAASAPGPWMRHQVGFVNRLLRCFQGGVKDEVRDADPTFRHKVKGAKSRVGLLMLCLRGPRHSCFFCSIMETLKRWMGWGSPSQVSAIRDLLFEQ